MTIMQKMTANFGLKVVSLFLALLLWLVATSGMESEIGLDVPVKYLNLSHGMTIRDSPPRLVEVTIAGPKILLWRLDKGYPAITIDLHGVGTGNLTVAGLDKKLQLDRGLRITRVYPSTLELKVRKTEKDVP